jgi:S-adenosylmethionine hydrolase
MTRPIALLTDFGLKDHYAGSIKGVILDINPRAVIFDLTHEIRPQNIREAAFVLNSVYPYAPRGTIFVVVVDPGVGSERQALCVKTSRGFLIAPDNGVLSLTLQKEKSFEARAITNARFFRKPVSKTFHGRDVFSPAAAWLSRKDVFQSFGPKLSRIHLLPFPEPKISRQGIQGEIVYIDRFGNAMTHISRRECFKSGLYQNLRVFVKGKRAASFKAVFSEGKPRELIAVWNSDDRLELAVRDDSAEKLYRLKVGDSVKVVW